MKTIFKAILVFTLAFCSLAVFADEVLTHPDAQIQIVVPTDWTRQADGDVLTIQSPDEAMAVVFTILNPKNADKALEEIDASLEASIGAVTWENNGEPKSGEINGMTCDEWLGSAKDGAVRVDCISLDTPSGKTLGIYWIDTPESGKKFAAEIETIMKGLKPIKNASTEASATSNDDSDDDDDDDDDDCSDCSDCSDCGDV